MKRRSLWLAGLAWVCPSLALAQRLPPGLAMPFYTAPDLLRGAYRQLYTPRSAGFAQRAAELSEAVGRWCEGDAAGADAGLAQARERWRAAALAWDGLSAVAIGPLLARRSQRRIDFSPTRPELIERAIRAEPADARAMERIGTPAKGLPALEWLLWRRPPAPGTAACRYALRVAEDIETEAQALAAAFEQEAARDWAADEQATAAATSELLNQWVGGLERLRWTQIERPLRGAGQGGRNAPAWPRAASGLTADSWAASWQALAALAAAAGNTAPQPGTDLVPLESYLRGRGLNPLADRLAAQVAQVAQASRLAALARPQQRPGVLAFARALAALKRLAEAELAPALDVHIGFSDADGD